MIFERAQRDEEDAHGLTSWTRSVLVFFLLCFSISSFGAGPSNLTVRSVSIDKLPDEYLNDARRIEVFYPKQFERLEMDWEQTVRNYKIQYRKAKSIEEKLHIFSRLYNSYNNAHHRPLIVKGLIKYEPLEPLALPFFHSLTLAGVFKPFRARIPKTLNRFLIPIWDSWVNSILKKRSG